MHNKIHELLSGINTIHREYGHDHAIWWEIIEPQGEGFGAASEGFEAGHGTPGWDLSMKRGKIDMWRRRCRWDPKGDPIEKREVAGVG